MSIDARSGRCCDGLREREREQQDGNMKQREEKGEWKCRQEVKAVARRHQVA